MKFVLISFGIEINYYNFDTANNLITLVRTIFCIDVLQKVLSTRFQLILGFCFYHIAITNRLESML